MGSYQVTAPTYGGYPPPPPHYQQYPGYEMSEFAASNPYKNGRVQPISSHHTSSNSNGHYKNSVPIEDDDEIDRGHWGSKAEFILSCVGYSVGIGNVWRFPYLAYSNGGGSFLIPYFILLIFIGKPMYYMETAIGQFSRLSPLQVWRCAPIAKGVGYAMCVVSLIVAIYYNVIMAYSIIYIGATVQGIVDGQLPWRYRLQTSIGTDVFMAHSFPLSYERRQIKWKGCVLHGYFSLRYSHCPFGPRSYFTRSHHWIVLFGCTRMGKTFRSHCVEKGRRTNVLLSWSELGWIDDVWILQQIQQQNQSW